MQKRQTESLRIDKFLIYLMTCKLTWLYLSAMVNLTICDIYNHTDSPTIVVLYTKSSRKVCAKTNATVNTSPLLLAEPDEIYA